MAYDCISDRSRMTKSATVNLVRLTLDTIKKNPLAIEFKPAGIVVNKATGDVFRITGVTNVWHTSYGESYIWNTRYIRYLAGIFQPWKLTSALHKLHHQQDAWDVWAAEEVRAAQAAKEAQAKLAEAHRLANERLKLADPAPSLDTRLDLDNITGSGAVQRQPLRSEERVH